ncbi:MAG: hypothetical protein J2P24_10245 [Streptosporangiales bacterium]|nr:hypothetical protein [Streptosporangiales bacterium]MBO0892449.1 hypothetical protein [Acidothermales bacterium]
MTEDKPRIELSAVQVVGGALAASSAAVAASLLGVAGTVIGAAVASIVTTIAGAMYTHSMRRGRVALERARTTHLTHLGRLPGGKPGSTAATEPLTKAETEPVTAPVTEAEATPEPETKPEPAASEDAERDDTATGAGASTEPADDAEATRTGWRERFHRLNARKVAITAACTLVLALGVITGVEALMGQPISSALGIDGHQRGTSIGLIAENRHRPPANSPTPGGTSTPSPTGATTGSGTPTSTPPTSSAQSSAPGTSPDATGGTSQPATQEPTQQPGTSAPPPPMHTAPENTAAP